jgi:hypothetical protein
MFYFIKKYSSLTHGINIRCSVENSFMAPQQIKHRIIREPEFHSWVDAPKELKIDTCTFLFFVAIFTVSER